MSEDYKVLIGAQAKESEFNAIDARIKNLTKPKPIKLQIDPNVTKQIGQLEKALERAYGNNFKLDLDLNVDEITAVRKGLIGLGNTIESISRVFNALEKSTASLSGLDGLFTGSLKGLGNVNANLNDLKSTFNDIENAIERTISSIDQLKKKTSSFTPNFDLGIKRSASEKNALIESMSTDLMPDLQDQAKKLMEKLNIRDIFDADAFAGKYFKGSVVQYTTRFRETYREAVQGMHQLSKGERQATSTEQAGAYRNLINLLREYATVSGANVSSLDSEFASISDRLKELDNVVSGADIDERLKNIFNIDTSKMEASLERIVQAIDKVNEALGKLGQGDPQAFTNITSELHNISEEFKQIKGGIDSLNQSFNQFNGDTRFKDLADSLNSLPQSISQLNGLAGSITSLSDAILVLQQDCDRINLAMVQGAQAAQRLRNAYGQIPNGMSEIGAIDLHLPDDNQIDRMRETLQNLGFDNIDTQNISRGLDEIFVRVNKIRTSFNQDGSLRMVVSGMDKEGRDVTATSRYRRFVEQDGSERFVLDSDPVIELTERFNGAELACQDLLDVITRIGSTEIKLAGLDPEKDAERIAELTSQLRGLRDAYVSLYSEAIANNIFDDNQINDIQDANDRMDARIRDARAKQRDKMREKQQKEAEKSQREEDKKKSEADDISLRFARDGEFDREAEKIRNDLNEIKYQSDDATNAVNALDNALAQLDMAVQSGDIDSILGSYEEYLRAKESAKAAVASNKESDKKIRDAEKAEQDEIDNAFKQMKKHEEEMAKLRIAKEKAKDPLDVNRINQKYEEELEKSRQLRKKYINKFTVQQTEELDKIRSDADKDVKLINDKEAKAQNEEVEKLLEEAEDKIKAKAEEIADIEIKLDKLEINEGSIAEIEKLKEQLEKLREEYRLLNQDLSNSQVDGDIALPDDVQKRIEDGKAYNRKVYEEGIASQAEKISKGFTSRKFEVDFESIKADLNNLTNATDETKQSVSALESAYKALDNAIDVGDNNQIIEAKKVYDHAKEEAQNAIRANKIIDDQIKAQQKAKNDTAKLEVNKRAFESGMDVWLNKNSEAADYFADKIANIRQRLKECDATELTQLRTEFTDLKRQAELAGKTVKSFGDRLSDQFKRFGTYFALDNIIDEAVQGIRDMYDQVVQIDTAMTDLYKVTDETPERYEQFLGSAQKGAKELGRSVSSYITQSAKWAQMGYGIGDSEQLAKISSIYSNVADVTDETAVGDIVATLKAFDLATSDAITIVDSLNKLGKLMPMRNYIG